MNFRKKILIFSFSASLILFGALGNDVKAQMSLDSLMEKIGQTSIEGRSALDILNAISQAGELDSSIPKRTIKIGEGKIETIFVFDFGGNHQQAFEDLQNYFMKEEGFLMLGQRENGGILGKELQKGTIKLLLVKKGNIVAEDRLEGFLVVANPQKAETGGPINLKTIIIIIGVVVVIIAGIFFAPRLRGLIKIWKKK